MSSITLVDATNLISVAKGGINAAGPGASSAQQIAGAVQALNQYFGNIDGVIITNAVEMEAVNLNYIDGQAIAQYSDRQNPNFGDSLLIDLPFLSGELARGVGWRSGRGRTVKLFPCQN